MNYRTFSDAPILLGLSVGSAALQVEALNDAAMVRDAMAAVRSLFGPSIPGPLAWRMTRWSRNTLKSI